MKFRLTIAAGVLLFAFGSVAEAHQVVQSRGVDSRVDYASLLDYGPWDDRNYELTLEDLAALAPNEAELRRPMPAFFRVKMRQHNKNLRREGPVQYPLSAPEIFRQMYGGFLIDGKIYKKTHLDEQGRLAVMVDESGVPEKDYFDARNKVDEGFLSGEVRVTNPNGAAESAIAIKPSDENIVLAGTNGPGAGQSMHFSSDGGQSWSAAAALPLGATCCDPTIEFTTDSSKAYASALGNCGFFGCDIWVYRTADDGQTWDDFGVDPRREVATGGGHDKQFLHVDRHVGSPGFENVYITWHNGNTLQSAVSDDFGETWTTFPFSGANDFLGVGSDVTTDKSGNVYVAWPAFNSQNIYIAQSTDEGITFGTPVVVASTFASFNFTLPSQESRGVAVIVSVDADLSSGAFADSLYLGFTDNSVATSATPSMNQGRCVVAYSRDSGATWTEVTPHPTGDTHDRWQCWMEVDDNGHVHVIYNSTEDSPDRTAINVYHQVSTDGGVTYGPVTRLTAETSPNITDGFEFGDYSSMSIVGPNGLAIYTDNRDESGGAAQSIDVYTSIIPVANDEIFTDGFESGDTSSWSAVVP